MYDCHYDLLTYIYMNRCKLKKVKKHCKKIFKNNITGGIFNLFYMSPKEMEQELEIEENKINLIDNLRLVNKLIEDNNIIPKNVRYICGIEGLDYLEKIEDIDILYRLGLRSINIVWNNDNKFGGGAKGDKKRGLTSKGEELVKKIVNKKVAIDLSHANERTFYDILYLCKELKRIGKNPIVFASHSNSKSICNVSRNLTDEQLLRIKELDGIIGIVSVKSFCVSEKDFNNDKIKYKNAYINHIKYVKKLLGGVDNIAISTDDMTYYKYNKKYYKNFNVFKQNKIKKEIESLLIKNKFTKKEIDKILYTNFEEKILQRL